MRGGGGIILELLLLLLNVDQSGAPQKIQRSHLVLTKEKKGIRLLLLSLFLLTKALNVSVLSN